MKAVTSEAVRMLMEIGMMAANNGMHKQAFEIFEGVEAVRPDQEYGPLGVALIHMNLGEYDQAVTVLKTGALERNPESAEAKIFLALALRLANRSSECDEIVRALRQSGDELSSNFAAGMLASS